MRGHPLLYVSLFLCILLVVDIYSYKGLRHLTAKILNSGIRKGIHWLYWAFNLGLYGSIMGVVSLWDQQAYDKELEVFAYTVFGVMLVSLVTKLVFLVFHLTEDLIWLAAFGWKKMIRIRRPPVDGVSPVMTRANFLTQMGVFAAAVPFTTFTYGILKGKYDFKVRRKQLSFPNLPPAFDGFRIVQISDFHIGSFGSDYNAVQEGIDMANELNPDVIFFTGDLVNNYADETDGWLPVFSSLNAPMGIYSILGNHDYGLYRKWPSEEDYAQNMMKLKQVQAEAGFQLLMNEQVPLERGGDRISLIGVENWGRPPFPQHGDLKKAMIGADAPFKVLLSHDPDHWDEYVYGKENIDLTFSGHTHGMQFGVNLGSRMWSPVSQRYPRWGGLYKEGHQYLYVNTGFGFIGFPGRIGMPPEVTLIELRRGENLA